MAGLLAALQAYAANPWIGGASGALFGAIVGSFLATLLIRWPAGEGALVGRSRCDSCQTPLGPRDLFPLLSFALSRGRCRACRAAVDVRHPAMELAAACVGAVALVAHPFPLALVTAGFSWALLLLIALDAEHHWLPDRLTLPLIPLGLVVAWAGFGPSLPERALGAAIGWAGLAALAWAYRALRGREGLGGGDPKLLAAGGAWLGASALPFILLGAGLVGLAAVLMMRLRGQAVTATSRLPLGSLMALAAWPLWLVIAGH